MALKDTANHLMKLLETCMRDLHKASGGNKAAAQRVRTGTIKLEKCSKTYRKESIGAEKKGGTKKPAKSKPAKKAGKSKKSKKR